MSVKLVEVKSFQELKELNVPQGTKIRYTCSICGKQREQKFINVINKGMLKCGSCLQTEVRRANPNYWDSYKKAKETYKKSYLESERYLNKQKALEEKFPTGCDPREFHLYAPPRPKKRHPDKKYRSKPFRKRGKKPETPPDFSE